VDILVIGCRFNQRGNPLMKKRAIKGLYYITHLDNLPSILRHGILSHHQIEALEIPYTAIYDPSIVSGRKERLTPDNKNLWEYANVYFQPRNPMLYRVLNESNRREVVVLGVSPQVLEIPGSFIAAGNAASYLTPIFLAEKGIQIITGELRNIIQNDWWAAEDGSKRKIMAECLVPKSIPPDLIHSVYVSNHQVSQAVRTLVESAGLRVEVVPEPHMFFLPRRHFRITEQLTLADGDLFFSQMQTLTISVNTVGVMGKGLASRAKYQFPDMYVIYQDLCRGKTLQMGKPYLYQREASLDRELADEPFSLSETNANKWFLLFPTKRHWKERSDIDGIENGLRWIKDNYKSKSIQSLAIPALGCGLGGLEWREIVPLMCKYLSGLEMQVVIYLPQEKEVPDEFLAPDFLLGR